MDSIAVFALIGFLAQLVDGALGMAYGVTSTTVLLTLGLAPATASASVHAAEVITTGVSGLAHWRFGNIERALIRKLLLPGVIGGVLGAYLLTAVPGNAIKPFVAAYLALMGGVILRQALRGAPERESHVPLVPLGLVGGFMDAVGGGGWGPIVTSTLIARGKAPKFSIGSVNGTEFFVTTAQSITFILTIGLTHWRVITGLILGGVVAAPLAAILCARLPARALMLLVGTLIVLLSVRTILLALA